MAPAPRVLVTGASGGIGAATVRALVRDGAQVAAHAFRGAEAVQALREELGEAVHPVTADLSDAQGPFRAMRQAMTALGGLDVLVANAGAWIASPLEPIEAWQEGWARNLTVNLQAAADLCRLAMLHFREHGGGAIITVTSRSAHRGDDLDHLAYGAAKGGLLSLTKGIARAGAADGILAYALAPGWVGTPLAAEGVDPAEIAALPLGEMTPPEDVAETIAFLASGRARHLTGATLDVTGADYVR